MNDLANDIRISFRGLARRPMFMAVAVLTLGLGIGAVSAMFAIADTVLLPELSYEEPERLVTLWQEWPGYRGLGKHINMTDDQYRLWRDEATVFEDVAMFNASEWGFGTLTDRGRPARIGVGSATASLADVVGIRPHLGRWFLADEEGDSPGAAAPVAVLSYEFWQRAFAGDQEIIGSTAVLDGRPLNVVGVLPKDFRLRWLSESPLQGRELAAKEMWVPYGQAWDCVGCGSSMYQGLGRLAEGVTVAEAEAEAEQILADTAATDTVKVRMVPRDEDEVRGLVTPLILLLAGAGLLLAIACGNIATLSVGEMQGRESEIATRMALGAGRPRIIRLVLVESVLLGLLGSAAGIVIAYGGIEFLKTLAPPIPRIDLLSIDFRLVLVATVLGILLGFLFGSAPALRLVRASGLSGLGRGARTHTWRSSRFQSVIIAAEIALAVVLLITGGLLVRSLQHLLAIDPGFDIANLATAHLSLPDDRYSSPEARVQFLDEVVRRLEAIPVATAVTAANGLPFPGRTAGWSVWLTENPTKDDRISTKLFHVAPGFHETLGIPLLAGRTFTQGDNSDAQRVALVDASLAEAMWPDESPIGSQLHYPWGTVTVVGVVADVKRAALAGESQKMFYVPFAQHPGWSVSFAVRTSSDAPQVISLMSDAVWEVDPDLAITEADVMTSLVARSASDERFRTLLIGVFGVLAAVLAAVGIFGVTARAVGRRKRELAIRIAVGAELSDLIRMVVGRNLWLGVAGSVVGVVSAVWITRHVDGFLFGVAAFDPPTYLAVCAFVIAISAFASFVPARRTAQVDPVDVLRAE